MSTKSIDTAAEENEYPESSQINAANPAIETPAPSSQPQPQRKEYRDSEGEDNSATDRASDGDDKLDGDFVPEKSCVRNSRVLRSQMANQESINSELSISHHTPTPDVRKRSLENHETEANRPAKRGRKPAARTEIKKFEGVAMTLVDEFKSKVREFEAIRTKNQELQLQVDSFKNKLKQAQQDYRRREISQNRAITSLESDCNEWRIKLAIALDEAKQDSSKYVKVSDSDIAGEWQKLSFNIRGLVSRYLTKKPTNECDELETLMKRLKRFVPLFLCEVSSLRTAVLRRAIWNFIILGVFSGERAIWHGEVGQMLTRCLSRENLDHLKDPPYLKIVSQMKFRAIADLSEESQLNKIAMDKLIDEGLFSLWEFIPDSMTEYFPDQMRELIMQAMSLHTIMMKSKAIFSLQWLGDDDGENLSPYSPGTMSSIQDDMDVDTSHYIVEFVEAPALMKYGNADGEDFEFSMALCKASVVLGEQKAASIFKAEILPMVARHNRILAKFGNAANRSKSVPER